MRPGPRRRDPRRRSGAVAAGARLWRRLGRDLDPDADQPAADITLRPEQVIQGRLFDVQGRPVQARCRSRSNACRFHPQGRRRTPRRIVRRSRLLVGSRQRLAGLAQAGDHRRRGPLHRARRGPRPPGHPHGSSTRGSPGRASKSRPTASSDSKAGDDWPGTGQDHHRPRHLCRHRQARPACAAHRHGHWRAGNVGSRPTTSRPTPRAVPRESPSPGTTSPSRPPLPRGSLIWLPPRRFEWPKGAVEQSLDLALPRGAVIRGKVTEEGSGTPVAAAAVAFASTPPPARMIPAGAGGRCGDARPMDRSSSPSRPGRAISSSWGPARITCSRRSAIGRSRRASRAARA